MEGRYVCTQYIGGPHENDWHYVTITAKPGAAVGEYRWTNQAGASWTVHSDGRLEQDCPYFAAGPGRCVVQRGVAGSDRVTGLVF